MRSRIFRAAVCLLVVCCLIVNTSLPQARAIAVADDIAIGITACLILMAAGVVFAPKTAADITAIGNSMSTYMYQWGTETEKSDEVASWLGGLTIYNGGSDEDGDGEEDTPHQRQVTLARGILGGITAWVASVIMAGGSAVEVTYDFATYNGVRLPAIPSDCLSFDYFLIGFDDSDGVYRLRCFDGDGTIYQSNVVNTLAINYHCTRLKSFICSPGGSQWIFRTENSYDSNKLFRAFTHPDTFIYCNIDVYIEKGGALVLSGSQPVPDLPSTEYLSSVYTGDIPASIQGGTLTADGIVLPDVLDYTELVPFDTPATDAIIDTSNDLIDGTLPYEDYLQQITGDAVTGVSIVAPDTVTAGSYITIQADVSGSGDFDTACTCTLSGAVSADTALTETEYDNTWTLSCGADETAQTLTVTVQSVADASITAVKEITVRESGATAPSEGTDSIPDYSGVLGGIQDAVGDLQTGIGNVVDGIANLPQTIMDGIKGLFVPDAAAMAAQQEKWTELLADRFGAVYESIALVDDLVGTFKERLAQGTIRIPSVTVDLAGTPFTFGGWDVDVIPDDFVFLVEVCKKIVDILCTLAFLSAMRKRFDRTLEG